SRVSIDFLCTFSEFQSTDHSQCISPLEFVRARFREIARRSLTLRKVMHKVEFRSVFRAPSQNFRILAIPNVLAHMWSYKHSFCWETEAGASLAQRKSK
ncbi:hypothetical protein GW17_00061867, partial [Ensete ventricosum]